MSSISPSLHFRFSIPLLLLAAWLFATFANAATAPTPQLNNTEEIDRYIVVFKPNLSQRTIREHIRQVQQHHVLPQANSTNLSTTINLNSNIQPTLRYSTIGKFQWYSGEFYAKSFENLLATNIQSRSNPIHYWEKDIPVSLQELVQTNPPSWGLDRIDQRTGLNGEFRFPTRQGAGVTVYLLDTGVYGNHTDLQDRVTYGPSVIESDPDPESDPNGHGTFVAGVCCGTEYGVAKKADIVSVKTLDADGNGMLSDLLKGLDWVVQQHVNGTKTIVNLSLGAMYSQAANDAIEEAVALGIHVVIAAGNYGEDACKYSPGSAPGAITVGAIDQNDAIAYYSNFGKCVDLFAPGTDIVSIYNTDDEATHTLTGTSMAAPHVTGAIALLLSNGDYTPAQMQEILKNTSTLLTEDFVIDTQNNENKTVLDNAINVGFPTNSNAATDLLLANLLFANPVDNQTFEVFGELYSAAHVLQPTITLTLMFVTLSLMSQLRVCQSHA